ncbi:MAG: hypothetical protein Q8N55_00215, partial [bacterium]|nr:hypothetical protein [bacterium]
ERGNLYLKGIFMKITNGESFTDIMNDLGVSETFVITVGGIIFCFAWPSRVTEMLQDIRTEYFEVKRILENYEHTQAQKVSVLPPSEGIEDTIHAKGHSSILIPADLSAIEGENIEDFVVDISLKIESQPLTVNFESGGRGDIRCLSSILTNDEIILINDSLRPGTKIVRQRESDPEKGACYLVRTFKNP